MAILRPRRRSRWFVLAAIVLLVGAPTSAAAAGSRVPGPAGALFAAPGDKLPDLRMARLRDVQVEVRLHRTLLRFTSVMFNIGTGPLEIRGRRGPGEATMFTWQRIFRTGGGYRDVVLPTRAYYSNVDLHNHWHLSRMQRFLLSSKTSPEQGILRGAKTGFCFQDAIQMRNNLPGIPVIGKYDSCGLSSSTWIREGISVGYGDMYDYQIPFQWVDITGIDSGDYRLCSDANQRGVLIESNPDNNEIWTDIRLDMDVSPPTVEVLEQRWENCAPASSRERPSVAQGGEEPVPDGVETGVGTAMMRATSPFCRLIDPARAA